MPLPPETPAAQSSASPAAPACPQADAELFRTAVEHAPNGVVVVGPAGQIVLVNAQIEGMFGYARAELLGQAIETLLPQRLRLSHRDQREAFFSGSQLLPRRAMGVGRDLCARRKDGSEFPAEIGLNPIATAAGNLVLCAIVDISQRKRTEAELRESHAALQRQAIELTHAKERAQAADRIKSTFLATMSHELRTPLNAILGFNGILLQGLAGPLTDEQRRQMTMVRDSARHLLALINDVLDISKIEAGQLDVAREPFDLRRCIDQAIAIVRPLAERKGLDLQVTVADGVALALGDERRVGQVLLNLLGNAIKFTDQGSVTLRADGGAGTPLRIAVADTGIGIAAADLPTLFQPFRQVDSRIARRREGTGLGLAISRRLAELMGGCIAATSQPGQGSVFSLTLPSAEDAPA